MLTPVNEHGTMNGATPVTVVSAPSSGTKKIIKTIAFYNADTASATITLRFSDGGTHRGIKKVTIATGDSWIFESTIVLDATTESLTALMSGTPSTTNPDFSSHLVVDS